MHFELNSTLIRHQCFTKNSTDKSKFLPFFKIDGSGTTICIDKLVSFFDFMKDMILNYIIRSNILITIYPFWKVPQYPIHTLVFYKEFSSRTQIISLSKVNWYWALITMIKMIEFCDLLKYIISYFITKPKMISITQFRKGSTILYSSVLQNYSSGKPNFYCFFLN